MAKTDNIGMFVAGGLDEIIKSIVDIMAVAMDDEKDEVVDRYKQFLVAGVEIIVTKHDVEVVLRVAMVVVMDVAAMDIIIDWLRLHDFFDFGLLHKMGIGHDHYFHILLLFLILPN